MIRVYVVATAVALFVANLEPSFAAQRPRQPSSAHSQDAVKEGRGVITSPYDSSRVRPYAPGGTSRNPFGPGVNYPYPDRPYGDPGRW